MPLGGEDVNLELVAHFQKAHAGFQAMEQDLKNIDRQSKQLNKTAGDMGTQMEKAGKAMTHIGRGGMIMAAGQAIRTVIQWAKEYEDALIKAAQAAGKAAQANLSMAQAVAGRGAGPGAGAFGAAVGRGVLAAGAAQGLMPEETRGAVAGIKGRTPEDRHQKMLAAIELTAAGVTGEERTRALRGSPAYAARAAAAAQARARAAGSQIEGWDAMQTNRRMRAQAALAREAPNLEGIEAERQRIRTANVARKRGLEVGEEATLGQVAKAGIASGELGGWEGLISPGVFGARVAKNMIGQAWEDGTFRDFARGVKGLFGGSR